MAPPNADDENEATGREFECITTSTCVHNDKSDTSEAIGNIRYLLKGERKPESCYLKMQNKREGSTLESYSIN